jgi:SAM-dependent methyltransferase
MEGVDGPAQLRRLIIGYRLSQALRAAAELGVADLLAERPRPVAELAAATGTHADALGRVLRLLASEGVFAETAEGWHLTELAQPLRSDAPQSMRWRAINDGEPTNWRAWGELPHAVRTGLTGMAGAFGVPLFEQIARDPAAAATFDQLMAEQTAGWASAILDAYDFAPFRTVVDVGGGRGALLAAILEAQPRLEGVLVDLPHVVPGAAAAFAEAGLADRARALAGDFFNAVPRGDLLLLKQVIHDWDEAQASRILASCHRAIVEGGRLLIVDVVLDGHAEGYARYLDVHMLVLNGGRERTAAEYGDLLAGAGFRMARIVPTRCELSVIEALPA